MEEQSQGQAESLRKRMKRNGSNCWMPCWAGRRNSSNNYSITCYFLKNSYIAFITYSKEQFSDVTHFNVILLTTL